MVLPHTAMKTVARTLFVVLLLLTNVAHAEEQLPANATANALCAHDACWDVILTETKGLPLLTTCRQVNPNFKACEDLREKLGTEDKKNCLNETFKKVAGSYTYTLSSSSGIRHGKRCDEHAPAEPAVAVPVGGNVYTFPPIPTVGVSPAASLPAADMSASGLSPQSPPEPVLLPHAENGPSKEMEGKTPAEAGIVAAMPAQQTLSSGALSQGMDSGTFIGGGGPTGVTEAPTPPSPYAGCNSMWQGLSTAEKATNSNWSTAGGFFSECNARGDALPSPTFTSGFTSMRTCGTPGADSATCIPAVTPLEVAPPPPQPSNPFSKSSFGPPSSHSDIVMPCEFSKGTNQFLCWFPSK